ncbi:prenyltransferase [Pontimonas sp.]|nr:prenyltransferase [Pontimonas sp.]MDA8862914.1 prenyltransferase [Pontimonas sp.]
MSGLRTLVVSSRPLSWVNTAFPFGLTYYLYVAEFDALFVVGTLFFLIPYNVLMYGINDVFDYESDLRNPRKGGVEGALLGPELHRPMVLLSTLLPLPFLVPLILWGSLLSTGVLALALFFVVAYSAKNFRFKEIPFVDSVTSSLHFVMPAVFAMALVGAELTGLSLTLLASFFFWGMASHAFGAVQDVLADREAGVGSIATAIGAKGTVRFAVVLYLVAGLVVLVTPWPLPLIAPVALLYVGALAPWWSVSDQDAWKANRSWKWFLGLNFVAGAVVVLVLFEWWQLTS